MTGLDPRNVAYACVLEFGKRWGEVASAFQRDDLERFFNPTGPRLHFWTRPRGGSKTTDVAVFALADLVTEAPVGSTSAVVAVNADQAALLIGAINGVVRRTPELHSLISVREFKAVNRQTGASVEVLSAADGSALFGRTDRLTICDEFCNWPTTRKSDTQYTALRTGVQKLPGAKLVLLSTPGEPSHPSRHTLDEALRSELWDVHEIEGPVAWQRPEDIDALRAELRPDEFERLIMGRWAASPDVLVQPEDLEAACVLPQAGLDAVPGNRYFITVDLGLKNDRTAIAVSHAEPLTDHPSAPRRVVCDHLKVWQGSKKKAVSLADVEEYIVGLSFRYNRAPVHADPHQAVGLIQRLNASGVRAAEFLFTQQSVGRIANSLVIAFQNRQILLPDDRELRTELGQVRLKNTGPGQVKLDNPPGTHDDRAVVLAMACSLLQGETRVGAAWLRWMREENARAAAQPPVVTTVQASLATDGARALPNPHCRHRWQRWDNGDECCVMCSGWREGVAA